MTIENACKYANRLLTPVISMVYICTLFVQIAYVAYKTAHRIRSTLRKEFFIVAQIIQSVANDLLPNDTKNRTITEYKIGKFTYFVISSSSEAATDTIYRKIEKLILRDCDRIQK
jgi:hypothetical protein